MQDAVGTADARDRVRLTGPGRNAEEGLAQPGRQLPDLTLPRRSVQSASTSVKVGRGSRREGYGHLRIEVRDPSEAFDWALLLRSEVG